MENQHERTEMMLGREGVSKLRAARVAVFGIGGVGGYAVEALCRAGVGRLDLIDSDRVSLTNINRQIIATHKTVGMYKTDAMRERIADINPEAVVTVYPVFYSKENREDFDLSAYDYIIDAIDSVDSKVELIAEATRLGVPIISAMGAGGKLDPTAFRVADISKTAVCPLAKAVRIRLRKMGINHLRVVYSEELPCPRPTDAETQVRPDREGASKSASPASVKEPREAENPGEKRNPPPSISFVPSVMGLILAGEVIKELAK
jgi:tRNA A37 threonylcarbamoyladenosine dehydratase